MNETFLQSFLRTGLFDIGDSDERLKWLRQAIEELEKKFSDNPSLLPAYTLVALDPNISDTEPVLIETEKVVTTYWQALRGKYPDMPRNIHRGVILNALYSVGTSNAVAARIIYLTALNFFPYAKLCGEKDLVKEMLAELGDLAEKDAVGKWSFVDEAPALKVGAMKINDLKFGTLNFNQETLKAEMRAAIGNDPSSGQGTQHGGNSQWGNHFADKSSQGITNAFNSAMEEFGKSLSPTSIETPINKFFGEFKTALDSNLKIAFSSLTAVERRSKLLWWKETLYSPSLKGSYRAVNKNILPVIMGCDLNDQIPKITPISADYLLRDTLFLLNEKKDEPIKFSEYFAALSDSTLKSVIKPYFTSSDPQDGRISLTDFIEMYVNDKIALGDLKSKTGVGENEETTLSEIAVAVLHDLLVKRLITK
ncbi:MAG: hypothetical protein M3O71_26380 [Bacteroidota bacterium]|nr:hypothetical protein [Bacteroidota bacterium]